MTAPLLRHALCLLGCALVVLAGCAGAPGGPASPASPATATGTTPDPPGTTPTPTPTGPAGPTPEPTPDGVAHESYVFDHAGVDGTAIEGGIAYPDGDDYAARFYVTVVGSETAADRFDHAVLDAGASAFVDDTSFAESALVVVQAFPASSHPDYRVESVRRTGDGLAVAINDSSEGATADITVETVLLRVRGDAPGSVTVTTEEGRTFATGDGVVTVTPGPTPTPEPGIERPYASDDPAENVAEPRALRVVNAGSDVNGYRVTVVYHDRPDCRSETPACGVPTREVEVLDRRGKLRPGANVTVPELAVREGSYAVSVAAEVPAGNGSRVTVTDSLTWRLDDASGDVTATISDDGVTVAETGG